MPRLSATNPDDMIQQNVGTFQFSAIRPEKLGGVEWTLVNVQADISGSIAGYEGPITNAVKEALKSCQRSPRVNNLVARVGYFGHRLHELHGYLPLSSLDLSQYHPFPLEDRTALYDALYSSIASAHKYSKDLIDTGMMVNCATFVITDGWDNMSKMTPRDIADELGRAIHAEETESHLTVLIGVNISDPAMKAKLQEVQRECHLSQFIDLGQADEKNLAKLANFVSRSISSQSSSLNSGGPSQPLQI